MVYRGRVTVELTWTTIKTLFVGHDFLAMTDVLAGRLVRFVESRFDLKKKFIRHRFNKSTRRDSMTLEG